MSGPARSAAGVARDLAAAGVSVVALGFVDSAAIVRTKVVPLARYEDAVAEGVGLSPLFDVAMSDDRFATVPGYIDGPSGDTRLRADPEATAPLSAVPGWAWAAVDQYQQDGTPHPACPRSFLRRTVERLADAGIAIRATFELEFSLGLDRGDDGFVPAHRGPGYSDIALAANHAFARDVVDALEAQGLGVRQFHPEYADGQFELSIAPRDPVAAADAALLTRQVVRTIAGRHGRRASFAPQVDVGTGNGAHVHVSAWDGERNLLSAGEGPAGMTDRGESFVAGILRELPAIVAVTAPTALSYLRLQPHHWSGATRCWGVENREAAIRFIADPRETGRGANAEIKPVDGTANAYLAMGAILAAGLSGVRSGDRLPPSTEEDPASLPETERRARDIEQLPATLAEAAERLAGSDVLRDAMGDFLFETFLATRRGEAERSAGVDDEELIRDLRWRY